jgi:hypothetical protein
MLLFKRDEVLDRPAGDQYGMDQSSLQAAKNNDLTLLGQDK